MNITEKAISGFFAITVVVLIIINKDAVASIISHGGTNVGNLAKGFQLR